MAYNDGPPDPIDEFDQLEEQLGGPNRNNELEQLEETVRNFSGWFSNQGSGMYLLILIGALLLWLASGFYIVEPGEEGVVQTFGRFSNVTTSGLNYHFPRPIQKVTLVNVEEIRREEIGFRTSDNRQQVLSEALMLTQDENIVQVELVVQYLIKDSPDFLFNVQGPDNVLRTTAEVALRSTVGKMTIDEVITEQRARVQEDTKAILIELLDRYGAGILVAEVQLQDADPPEQVIDAFQEVVRALADKERVINQSEAYQNDIVPKARGEKQRAIEEASAFKDQRVLRATGDAERFTSVLNAYSLAPDVTRERMYIEALESVLRNTELTLIDQDALGGQVLPFLPLGGNSNSPPFIESTSKESTSQESTNEGDN